MTTRTSSKSTSKSTSSSNLTPKDEYIKAIENQKKLYNDFNFEEFTDFSRYNLDRGINTFTKITGRKLFKDFKNYQEYAELFTLMKGMAQSKNYWDEFERIFKFHPATFSSYYKIMGNLPWYNNYTKKVINTLNPNWERVYKYIGYFATTLGVVIDENRIRELFNPSTWNKMVEETMEDINHLIKHKEMFDENNIEELENPPF